MATVAQTVIVLIGDDMVATLVSSYEDLIRDGFNFLADLIPATSELWNSVALEAKELVNDSDYTLLSADGIHRKVIKVTRQESGDITREALEIPYKDYLKGADPTSIFYHGRSTTLPVWTHQPNGQLIISPDISGSDKAYVRYFEYIRTNISGNGAAGILNAAVTTGGGRGFPIKAFFAACIKCAINLIQARISDAAQDDEDMELLQILQTQAAGLEKLFQTELQLLQIPYRVIGVPDDVK